MLAPTDRRPLLDVLAPPEGYVLDQAVGTQVLVRDQAGLGQIGDGARLQLDEPAYGIVADDEHGRHRPVLPAGDAVEVDDRHAQLAGGAQARLSASAARTACGVSPCGAR
jgi:hypothetical protein